MSSTGVDAWSRVMNGRPLSRAQAPRQDVQAVVTKVDSTGVYVTPEGDDQTVNVIGPCRNAFYRQLGTCVTGAHTHPQVPLPLGAVVLLVRPTNGDPWVFADRNGL